MGLGRIAGWFKAKPSSSHEIEAELYNAFGNAIVEQAGSVAVSVLAYVELSDDAISSSLRYSCKDSLHIEQGFLGNEGTQILMKLQEHLSRQGDQNVWTAMEYFVDYGEVNTTLSYDPIDEDEPFWDRSAAIIAKYFPGKEIVRKSLN